MAALGDALRKLRESRPLSRKQVAERAGMSDVYYGTLEQGLGKRPGLEKIARLAYALEVPADRLFAEIGLPTISGGNQADQSPLEVTYLYEQLDPAHRQALVRIGHVLREAQAGYATLQRDSDVSRENPSPSHAGEGAERPPSAGSSETEAPTPFPLPEPMTEEELQRRIRSGELAAEDPEPGDDEADPDE